MIGSRSVSACWLPPLHSRSRTVTSWSESDIASDILTYSFSGRNVFRENPSPRIAGKRLSYSISLWERARVRARSVEEKGGGSLCSLIPHPTHWERAFGSTRKSQL